MNGILNRTFFSAIFFLIFSCSIPAEKNNDDHPKNNKSAPVEIPPLKEVDNFPKERFLRVDHYPSSNEMRIDLFRPYIENLKGVYVGVGTDQNLTFIAWAKSDFAYLMDFDPVIVAVNRIHMFFIERSATAEEFLNYWDRKNKNSSFEIVKEHFKNDPDYPAIELAWKIAHRGSTDVPERIRDLHYMTRKFGLKTFVNDPEQYQFIRKMILEKRILAVAGDLTSDKTMRSISRAVQENGLKVKVLYMSNAEEYFRYPDNFRKNIISLPADNESIIIRTTTVGSRAIGYPAGEKFEEVPFHYGIQKIENMKKWMEFKHYLSMWFMLQHRNDIEKGFSRMEKTPEQTDLKETGNITQKPAGWKWM